MIEDMNWLWGALNGVLVHGTLLRDDTFRFLRLGEFLLTEAHIHIHAVVLHTADSIIYII